MPILIHHPGIQNIKYDLCVNVTAHRTFAHIALYLGIQAFEIGDRLYGIAIPHQVSSNIQDQHIVEHLVYVR